MTDLFATSVPAPAGAGTFQTLMADPPWLERGSGQIKRGADRHYQLMKTDAICALPVSSWMAADSHAYVWVTNNFLEDGLRVLRAWGFRPITKIDWFKGDIVDVDASAIDEVVLEQLGHHVGSYLSSELAHRLAAAIAGEVKALAAMDGDDDALQMGIGQYFRGVTESCLFGVRGTIPYRMRPDGKRAQGRTGFHAPRTEHSVKPDTLRRMVELVSPGPYLEMFARRPAPGWTVWGNEITEASHA